MSVITKIKLIVGSILTLTIIGTISFLIIENKKLKEDLSYTTINMKAYDLENSHLKDRILVYQLDINQLNYLNDSLLVQMNKVRVDLGIKDKEIRRLEYLSSKASRTDTIYINRVDTIFKDTIFHLDTCTQDKWYSLQLEMTYPNKIVITPTFKSEKYIMTYVRKETIKPPKKCTIGRWFQRKHNVLEVEIVEKNPYIVNDKQKFVEIIK